MTTTENLTALIGERVTATGDDGATLTGVLIPPALPGRSPRLHADDGQITEMCEGCWTVQPVDRSNGGRRRVRCPDNRPMYRSGDLPSRQLATKTMLRQARLRPAQGQEPIATYWTTRSHAPLYAVADAEQLRPLPQARQAAWEAARTCARCGARRGERTDPPWPEGVDGRRYCDACQEPAAAEAWRRQRETGREMAATWAKDVLMSAEADPDQVVLVDVGYQTITYRPIAARTWRGELLMDVRVCTGTHHYPDYVAPEDVVDRIQQLQGKRLIGWRTSPRDVGDLLRMLRGVCGVDVELPRVENAGPHWDEWCAQRPQGLHPHHSYRTSGGQGLRLQEPPGWDAEQLLGHIHQTVMEMATSRPYWWRVTCQAGGCGKEYLFGTSQAASEWSTLHHNETGHTLRHTTEPGM